MNAEQQLPQISSEVITACGSQEKFSNNIPRVFHEGEWVFFCIPACQQEFIQDPGNSSCVVDHSNSEVN